MKKGKKEKKSENDLGNTKEIIDLSKFIHPDMVKLDDNGSYTGMTKETITTAFPKSLFRMQTIYNKTDIKQPKAP